jgi:hypothetical protein
MISAFRRAIDRTSIGHGYRLPVPPVLHVARAIVASRITIRFSALWFGVAAVNLKLPVITIAPSITMILLWAIATRVSTQTGRPALLR